MVEKLRLALDRLATPIGELILVVDGDSRLRATEWADLAGRLPATLRRHAGAHELAPARDPGGIATALARYFAGALDAIDDIPVATAGTGFQRAVWNALREIPCGQAVSYGSLAARIGRPTAVRAVGLANGANPVSVVIPCHRVIGSDGTLTGYGGGLERKRWLLAHEGARHG